MDEMIVELGGKTSAFDFTAYDSMIAFVTIVASVSVLFMVSLLIATYPPKCLVKIIFRYPVLDLNTYYFYYQKAASCRLLYINHFILNQRLKILGSTAIIGRY